MKYIAYKFENDSDLIDAIEYIQTEVASTTPVQYDVVAGSSILVVPAYLREHVNWVATKYGGKEVKTKGFSQLDPKERTKRRGHLLKRTA